MIKSNSILLTFLVKKEIVMNDKKQNGFKIAYVVVLLVVVLLFALMFVDFGHNGKELTNRQDIFNIIDGTYKDNP